MSCFDSTKRRSRRHGTFEHARCQGMARQSDFETFTPDAGDRSADNRTSCRNRLPKRLDFDKTYPLTEVGANADQTLVRKRSRLDLAGDPDEPTNLKCHPVRIPTYILTNSVTTSNSSRRFATIDEVSQRRRPYCYTNTAANSTLRRNAAAQRAPWEALRLPPCKTSRKEPGEPSATWQASPTSASYRVS